jgi:hypothetical protein
VTLERFSAEWVAPLSHGGKFNNLYFVVEKLFIMEFIINGFNNNRTFLLGNVLVEMESFMWFRGAKMLLDTISGMDRKIAFY